MVNLSDLGLDEEFHKFNFSLEIYKKICDYSTLIPYITHQRLDKWNSHVLANKFLEAQELTNELYSISLRIRGELEAEKRRQKSIAFHERSVVYLDSKKIKATDSAKANYVDMDEDVIKSISKFTASEALTDYLARKFKTFSETYYLCKQAHDIETN